MFLHRTKDEFSSDFRKLLMLEQHKNDKIKKLCDKYFVSGPIKFMTVIFLKFTDEKNACAPAIEFCGPLFMLYSLYDVSKNKNQAVKKAQNHVLRIYRKTANQRLTQILRRRKPKNLTQTFLCDTMMMY